MDAKQLLIVTSRAQPGREQEYRDWYVNTHIGEVCAVPGFLSGQLNVCTGPDGAPTGQYRAIYQVEDKAPGELMGALMSQSASMNMTDSIDPKSVEFVFLTPA